MEVSYQEAQLENLPFCSDPLHLHLAQCTMGHSAFDTTLLPHVGSLRMAGQLYGNTCGLYTT